MPRYQLVVLDSAGRPSGPPMERRCATDKEALLLALDVIDHHPAMEVWADQRVVGRVTARDAQSLRDRMRGKETGLLVYRGLQEQSAPRLQGWVQ